MAERTYRVRGRLDDPDGIGVLGRNAATTGTPIGVAGGVCGSDGYGLYTGDDAHVGGTLGAHTVSVADTVAIDYTGTGGGDHGIEVVDRSTDNSEQISIKADPQGTGELVFQDTAEANYKWGLRATARDDFFVENHDNLTTRLQLVKQGPSIVRNSTLHVRDGPVLATGTDGSGRAIDAAEGGVRSAGGVVNQQRSEPTTAELAPGENMTYNSDGNGTGAAGDLVYAVNDAGTIKTNVIARRSDATA